MDEWMKYFFRIPGFLDVEDVVFVLLSESIESGLRGGSVGQSF